MKVKKRTFILFLLFWLFNLSSCSVKDVRPGNDRHNIVLYKIENNTMLLYGESEGPCYLDAVELFEDGNVYTDAKAYPSTPWGTDSAFKWVRTIKVKEGNTIVLNKNSKGLFYGAKIKEIDLSQFDFSEVEDVSYMFADCPNLTRVVFNTETPRLTDTSHMFENDDRLEFVDFTGFDTSLVTDMSYMFAGCRNLIPDTGNFKTENVKNMCSMFRGAKSIKPSVALSFETGNVCDMSYMFADLSNEITGKSYMFKFDTAKVENMSGMFRCFRASELDISSFDTKNVTDMSYMFEYTGEVSLLGDGFGELEGTVKHEGLRTIDLSNFNTSKVVNMEGMFKDSGNLEEIDLSSFDLSCVENMKKMFRQDGYLVKVTFGNTKTTAVKTFEQMFLDCVMLEVLDMSVFDFANCENNKNMFTHCYKLKGVKTEPDYNEWGVIE